MALFTTDELGHLLGETVDTDRATLAREMATGLVEAVTGPLESATSTVTLPVLTDGTVDLPGSVITAVSAVTVDGDAVTYSWRQPFPKVRIQDWAPPTTLDDWPTAVITYTHGYARVPAVAKAVALTVAARAYANPRGLFSVAIDDYREQAAAGAEAAVALTDYERGALAPLSAAAWVTGT